MTAAAYASRGDAMTFRQNEPVAALRTWLFHLAALADESDVTGVVPVVTLSKDGAAFGAMAGAVTEISGGWYKVVFAVADFATAGALGVLATGTGAAPVHCVHQVIAGGLNAMVISGGTAQAGAAQAITLAASESAVDHTLEGAIALIVSGLGVGQHRQITGYTGASKVAVVDRAWATNPDATSVYVLLASDPGTVDPVILKDGSLTASKVSSDAYATFAGRLESKPNTLVGTLTGVLTSVARSMRKAYDTKITLAGTWNGATVKVESTEDETAAVPVWTDQSAGGLTADGTVTITGPHSAWRARTSAGAVTSVTVKAADRTPQVSH